MYPRPEEKICSSSLREEAHAVGNRYAWLSVGPRQWSQPERANTRFPAHRQLTCWEKMAEEQEHRRGIGPGLKPLLCTSWSLRHLPVRAGVGQQ